MIPREHGAWTMLLVPFAGAVLLARRWDASLIPACLAMVTVFLLRAPLLLLARQRWVWQDQHPESAAAARWALLEGAVLAASGLWLLALWPWRIVLLFGCAAAALTVTAVLMAVRNQQRSIALQVVSAAGLAASPFVVSFEPWAVWLWLLSTGHSVASILVVHARLEARIAAKAPGRRAASIRPAWIAQFVVLAGAAACAAANRPLLAAALALSSGIHMSDLRRLNESVPLRTVGLRAMTLSILFAALVVAGLWRES